VDYFLRLKRIVGKLTSGKIDAFLTSYPPNLRYLCGFKGEEGTLLLTSAEQILLINSLYYEQAQEERDLDIKIKLIKDYPVAEIGRLSKEIGLKSIAIEKDHISYHFYRQLQEKLKEVSLHPVQNWVENLRQIKEEEELKFIKEATAIANRAFVRIKELVKPGLRENEVARKLEYLLKEEGSEELPFPVIVASGRRSTFPHARPSNKIIEKGEILLIDFGARYQGYCSDLTRTIYMNIISGEKKEIYNLVQEAQREAIKLIKPGVEALQVDRVARVILKERKIDKYFGHGLGHGLGLEVHEQPRISPKTRCKLKENMIFTVEPAVYIPRKYGIRIEDMVRVTKTGCEIISKIKN